EERRKRHCDNINDYKRLAETINIGGIKFSSSWAEHFKQQYRLVKCARTQIAQKISEDMPVIIKNFLKTLHEKAHNIEKKYILSFDETSIREKLPPIVIFKLKKKPKGKFPRDIIIATALSAIITGNLIISTYIPWVIRARQNRFFKNKGIIFVDAYHSHNRNNVIRAFNTEGLNVLEIPGRTTSVLQPPNVSVNKPFKNEMKKRDIERNILVKSFEASGLTLDPNGSEDDKMSHHFKAIVENRLDELSIDDEEAPNYDNGELDDDELDNGESDDDELDDSELDDNELDFGELDYGELNDSKPND
ncbi:19772_t:CDS:2, partial [Dentiscutata erythropus]